MKLVISKNKDGNGYYTKLTNEYNGKRSEMYLSLQVPKGNEIEYGLYEIDGFLTCYTANDGSVKPKLVITNAVPTQKYEKKETGINTKTMNNGSDPFSEIEIDITENMLD